MANPEKEVKCNFLNINFENKMLESEKWENSLNLIL